MADCAVLHVGPGAHASIAGAILHLPPDDGTPAAITCERFMHSL